MYVLRTDKHMKVQRKNPDSEGFVFLLLMATVVFLY